MDNRINAVVTDIVEGIRDALRKHDVTFDEYRAGVRLLMQVAESKETPLMIDVFMNSTIVEIENRGRKGSSAAIQGPYFREGAPHVSDRLAIRDQDKDHAPMLLRGRLTDIDGKPVAGAVIDIWHSTPEGRYSGVHDGIDIKYYRGKVTTDANGGYAVRSIVPVPYQIPNQGPTGALLEMMGTHSWRPAHVHYWIHADGYRPLISQAYFEGGDYVDDDCCNGVSNDHIVPEAYEDGVRIMDVNFRLEPAAVNAVAAE